MAVATRPNASPYPESHAPRDWTLSRTLVAFLLVGVALPVGSSTFGLYDHILHWGKLVHAVDGFCATVIFSMLLFAWRDATAVALPDELGSLLSIFAGIFFGVMWEIVEFIRDWVAYSDLQKSNTDTMTDLLGNDVA